MLHIAMPAKACAQASVLTKRTRNANPSAPRNRPLVSEVNVDSACCDAYARTSTYTAPAAGQPKVRPTSSERYAMLMPIASPIRSSRTCGSNPASNCSAASNPAWLGRLVQYPLESKAAQPYGPGMLPNPASCRLQAHQTTPSVTGNK